MPEGTLPAAPSVAGNRPLDDVIPGPQRPRHAAPGRLDLLKRRLPIVGERLREKDRIRASRNLRGEVWSAAAGGRLSVTVLNDAPNPARTVLAAYLASLVGDISHERVLAVQLGVDDLHLDELVYGPPGQMLLKPSDQSGEVLAAVTHRQASRHCVKAARVHPALRPGDASAEVKLATCIDFMNALGNMLIVDVGPQQGDASCASDVATLAANVTVFVASSDDQSSLDGCARAIENMRRSEDERLRRRLNQASMLVVLGAQRLETDTYGERFGFHGKVMTVPSTPDELLAMGLNLDSLPSATLVALLGVIKHMYTLKSNGEHP